MSKAIRLVCFVLPLLVYTFAAYEAAASADSPDTRLHGLFLSAGDISAVDSPPMDRKDHTCVINNLSCNSTVQDTLTTHDCRDDPDVFHIFDTWEFHGSSGTEITINMSSMFFDTHLLLFDPSGIAVAEDNDSGVGDNSRLTYILDSTGQWAIQATHIFVRLADEGDVGPYALSLECSGDGQESPPAAPTNLTALTRSTTEINLFWQDNSDNENDFQIQVKREGGSFQNIGTVSANVTGASITDLEENITHTFRVRARNSAGNSPWSNEATAATDGDGGPPPNVCDPPSDTAMCLNSGRFRVEVDWRDFNGNIGEAMVVPFGSDDSGLFYFFTEDNWEMLVKVLNGCGITNHFWVFAAATTTVEYTLRVTDTETSAVKQYFNPLGNAPPAITDTSAFATCP